MLKKITSLFFLFSLSLTLAFIGPGTLPVHAQNVQNTISGLDNTAKVIPAFKSQTTKNFNTNFVASYAGRVIGIILSFIGVIFLGLMIYGGLMWMMAEGNEQKVGKAKDLITNAIIGLIIVFTAYAITAFLGQKFIQP